MNVLHKAMPVLRSVRLAINPALRASLGRVNRHAWPGVAMNYVGCGAPIMVGKGETVLLCGVFQGSTVTDFARSVGPSGRVVVIEANPVNALRLKESVGLPQVVVENRAVWWEDSDLEFEFAEADKAQLYNRVRDDSMQPFPKHMVASTVTTKVRGETLVSTMDRLGIHSVDHLNLTVNGAEWSAFKGAAGDALAPRVSRVYAHTELPEPGQAFADRLSELGFQVRLSRRLNSRNPDIDLRRLYAWKA